MKQIGEKVKLRLAWGESPEAFDLLETRAGRRYLVLEVRGKTVECLVVGPDAMTTGRRWDWQWETRKRRITH